MNMYLNCNITFFHVSQVRTTTLIIFRSYSSYMYLAVCAEAVEKIQWKRYNGKFIWFCMPQKCCCAGHTIKHQYYINKKSHAYCLHNTRPLNVNCCMTSWFSFICKVPQLREYCMGVQHKIFIIYIRLDD